MTNDDEVPVRLGKNEEGNRKRGRDNEEIENGKILPS
jgi:hypothetical protein